LKFRPSSETLSKPVDLDARVQGGMLVLNVLWADAETGLKLNLSAMIDASCAQ